MFRIRSHASSLHCHRLWAAAFLLTSCGPALGQTAPPPPTPHHPDGGTLKVSGQATLQVEADRALVSFSVETEGESAREASRRNAERMDAVIRALRGASVPGLEVETFGYSISPEYQVPREGERMRTISGYRARNNIRVRLPEIEVAGEILDLALEAGANRVSGLTFEASDTGPARLQALREAVATAREEAETIAAAMGVVLGPVVEVQGGASPPAPRGLEERMFRSVEAQPATPIEAGSQSVSATVTITYRILEHGH